MAIRIVLGNRNLKYGRQKVDKVRSSTGIYGRLVSGNNKNAVRSRRRG